jgi:hypothetical protein
MFLNSVSVGDCITVDFAAFSSATTQQFTFPDIPYLRDKKVYSIALNCSLYGVETGLTNIGYIVASGSLTNRSAFLTLYDNTGEQFFQDIPLQELIPNTTFVSTTAPDRLVSQTIGQKNGLTIFAPRIIQWTKCSIYFPVAMGIANLCFQFDIFYQYKK